MIVISPLPAAIADEADPATSAGAPNASAESASRVLVVDMEVPLEWPCPVTGRLLQECPGANGTRA